MKKKEIYQLGTKLGLQQKEIEDILNNTPSNYQDISFSIGPPGYGCTFYGTISIRDF